MRRFLLVGLALLAGCASIPVVSEQPESLGYENCHLLESVDEFNLSSGRTSGANTGVSTDYASLRHEATKAGGNVVYAHAGRGDIYRCEPPRGAAPSPCAKDADCKFDRVCERGVCVNPGQASPKY